jgi:hypothetical protein
MSPADRSQPLPIGPEKVRQHFEILRERQRSLQSRADHAKQQQQELTAFLQLAPGVADRLDDLSQRLFGDILKEVELNLTYALQEVLEQDQFQR